MAETEPLFSVPYKAQTNLPLIVPALFVVPALRQRVPTVRAGHPGVEIRRVIGQQTVADHLLFSPDRQQPRLRPLEFIFFSALAGLDAIKAIPEFLRGEPLGRETPQRRENRVPVPFFYFRLGPGLTDAVNSGQQQIMRGGGAGTRFRPVRGERSEERRVGKECRSRWSPYQ